jgi:hypothetical protein
LKLTEAELRAILPELPSIGAANALAAKIQLATGARLGELAKVGACGFRAGRVVHPGRQFKDKDRQGLYRPAGSRYS